MSKYENKYFIKILVLYYGIIQSVHLAILIRAALFYNRYKRFIFPALPPPDGWSEQSSHFLLVTGLVDGMNVFLILLFVFGFFKKLKWSFPLGLFTLSIVLYSAIVYLYATITSGAWTIHTLSYLSVALCFSPIIFLMIYFAIVSIKGEY